MPSKDSQRLLNARHILGSHRALPMLYLVASFAHHSEVDTSIIILCYNWENWGTERSHHISSVILSVLSLWPLYRHCLWHNPHFHLGFLRNSLNSLKRLHVSWWGLGGGENGTASGLHEPCSVPTFRCILCRRKELVFSSSELVMLQIMGWQVFSGLEKLPLCFLLESNITQ